MSEVRDVRELRALVLVEVAVVVGVAIAYAVHPRDLPAVVPLLVAATASRWARGRGWAELTTGGTPRIAAGVASGLVALALALLIGTPIVEEVADRAVQWSTFPMVR